MSGVFSRKDAERFNDLLEADRSTTHNELSPLLTLTQQLSALGSTVHADPEFAARCRTRLLAVATVQETGNSAAVRSQGWRRGYQGLRRQVDSPRRVPRRLALLSGTLAALLGLSSMGMASGSAMPGDALYTIKRSKETAQLAFARSDISRGQLHLQFARTRLNEAQAVGSATGVDTALTDADADTRSAMRDMGESAISHGSTSPLDAVDQFVTAQRQDLQAWMNELPSDKRTRAAESLSVLDDVGQRSQGLRGTLACGNGASGASTTDELGPLPRGCAAAPAPEQNTSDEPRGQENLPQQPTTAPAAPSSGSSAPSVPSPSPSSASQPPA
ncbi:MAG: DUF5667 domain-containing protein, partial [Mycobacteriales bacterium]